MKEVPFGGLSSNEFFNRSPQILWRLVGHTARFAVFIVVVMMTSFALAFYSLFFSCEEGSELYMFFGKFHRALLTVFAAALGEFGTIIDYYFDLIEDHWFIMPYYSTCLLLCLIQRTRR